MNNTVKITKGFKYRIYPTESQKQIMEQTFGNVRFVYNYFLNLRSEEWLKNKNSISYNKTSSLLTDLKKKNDYSWLKLCDSMALQEALRDLDRAYQGFFKNNNNGTCLCRSCSTKTRNSCKGIKAGS